MQICDSILKNIVISRKHWIKCNKNYLSITDLKNKIKPSTRNFYETIFNTKKIFIFEYKKASLSKGLIYKNHNPEVIANIYKHYASVISVITEEKYFQGNFNLMFKISNIVHQPLLCKDFFIDPWQIYFARLYNADAILLILSILDDSNYIELSKIAHNLNMGILTEIHNEEEAKRAIKLEARVIGINNRNLHDLSINLNNTINLSKFIPNKIPIISESGICNYNQLYQLNPFVKGFLIGSVIMSKDNLDVAIRKLIVGENKICGLTRPIDAYAAYKAGAIYGGLIFINNSPRYINEDTAFNIVKYSKLLKYVGVFCNAQIDYIINIAIKLNLIAIQLHGQENQSYINILRLKLPSKCQIWKVFNVNKSLSTIYNLSFVNRYILDNQGGSGKSFDWSILNNTNLNNIMLAGGLNIHNCLDAVKLGCIGLDFNSGVESAPGIKDHKKLYELFQKLHI